ncbi:MFS transporter [Streptomyces sp. L2]|uniref:MFS transporter n=1 Tax=Streptomyces sp. L2 TaxID=2162665 RepID=UPI001011ACB6|nr:MFS transporter [Streptomyces sp. L2]
MSYLARPAPAPTAAPAEPGRLRVWSVTVLIMFFMLINFADKSVLGLAAVPIMRELHLDHAAFGLLASSFYLLFSVASLVVGFVSTRVSSRWILFALAVCWAAAQVPVLVVAAAPTLFASRILLGAAEGPAASMTMHALYTWFPEHRRSLPTALQVAGGAAAALVAAPVLTWIIDEQGWRAAFLALAVVAALWAAVWLPVGGEGPYAAGPSRAAGGTRVPYRVLFGNGTVVGGVAAAFGAYWATALSSAWLPAYLQSQLHYRPQSAATVLSGIAALGVVLQLTVVPFTGRLIRRGVSSRWARGAVQGGVVALAGACMALFPHLPAGPLRVTVIAVAFTVGSLAYPLSYLNAGEVLPPGQRGAALAVSVTFGTLPGIIAPGVSGVVIDHLGYTAAFTIGAAVMIPAGVIAALMIRPQRTLERVRAHTITPPEPS